MTQPENWVRDRILARAKALGYGPYQLATQIGDLSLTSSLSRYFRGVSDIKSETLSRILDALELELADKAHDPPRSNQGPANV